MDVDRTKKYLFVAVLVGLFYFSRGLEVCPNGQYRAPNEGPCTDCEAGKWSQFGNDCVPCSAGRYAPSAGTSDCLYVADNYGPGYYSPDKISVDLCEDDSYLEIAGVSQDSNIPLRSTEYIPGKSTMTCNKCPSSFGASECSLSTEDYEIVSNYRNSTDDDTDIVQNDVISRYRKCAIQCGLFSLHASDGVVWGLSVVLAVLFFCGFLFLEKEIESKGNDDEDAESDMTRVERRMSDVEKEEDKAQEQDKEQEETGYNWVQAGTFFVFVATPVADTITDLAYIISSKFYNVEFFVASLLAFLIPNIAFCRLLYTRNRVLLRPKLYLPGISVIPEKWIVTEHDNLVKVLYSFFIYFPWALLNFPHLLPKMVLGMLLYSTKVFAIGGVYNRWCRLWTGANEDSIAVSLDTVVLNESIFMEIVWETFPQVVIQITNNYYINPDFAKWGEVNLASLVVTLLNTINGLWKIVYWKLMRGVNLVDIPVSFGGTHSTPSYENIDEKNETGVQAKIIPQSDYEVDVDTIKALRSEMKELKVELVRQDAEISLLKSQMVDCQMRIGSHEKK